MNKRMLVGSCALAAVLVTQQVSAEAVHWDYSGKAGPEHWGDLAPEFSACSSGRNQSPINLSGMVEGELPKLKIDYKPGGNEAIINNGHAIQVNYAPGSTLSLGSNTFELKQFHFHSPSENTIEGKHAPMEAHFVHADAKGNLAVIAVMFQEGGANAELEKAWTNMPAHKDETKTLPVPVDAAALLPKDQDYFRFNGSLTTPPCSEGVVWLVMKEFNAASKEQIGKFTATLHHPNNRPVQPINARVVIQ